LQSLSHFFLPEKREAPADATNAANTAGTLVLLTSDECCEAGMRMRLASALSKR
jgi:hypothetical protein